MRKFKTQTLLIGVSRDKWSESESCFLELVVFAHGTIIRRRAASQCEKYFNENKSNDNGEKLFNIVLNRHFRTNCEKYTVKLSQDSTRNVNVLAQKNRRKSL